MSVTPAAPPPGNEAGFTLTNVGVTASAFCDKYKPTNADGGAGPPQHIPSPERPLPPSVLPTKMLFPSAGSTTIFVIEVPMNACPPPPFVLLSNGPSNVGVVSALIILYRPTPKKLSSERLPSPVPTNTVVGLDGLMVTAPMANDCALSIRGVQVVPPSVVR